MLGQAAWIDESLLRPLLPGSAARFAHPVAYALQVFLRGLTSSRQAELVAAQAALPGDSTVSQRLVELARGCPVLHKLGQVLARDSRLAHELRIQLQTLETMRPRYSQEQLADWLQAELGPLDKRGVRLTGPPLAEASVAVVVPCELSVGMNRSTREGVLKILKPGMEDRLAEELELLTAVGAELDRRCEELGIPQLDYQEAFQQVRLKLAQEICLDREQEHLRQARRVYAADIDVVIPEPFGEYCTARVTAMQRVRGVKITEHGFRLPQFGQQLAARMTRVLLAEPLLSKDTDAVFHGDPHAGNLLLTPRGQLAILDWSLVGHLGRSEREAIMQIFMAACLLDAKQIVQQLQQLAGARPVAMEALHQVVQMRLEHLKQGQFPGLNWLIGLLDEAAEKAQLRGSSEMLLLRKVVHMLHGLAWELGGSSHQVDETLLREFWLRFLAEWPWRWCSPLDSRDFATRLSNLDLTRFLWSLPWAASRYRQTERGKVTAFRPPRS